MWYSNWVSILLCTWWPMTEVEENDSRESNSNCQETTRPSWLTVCNNNGQLLYTFKGNDERSALSQCWCFWNSTRGISCYCYHVIIYSTTTSHAVFYCPSFVYLELGGHQKKYGILKMINSIPCINWMIRTTIKSLDGLKIVLSR